MLPNRQLSQAFTDPMTPLCPVCKEPMKEHRRSFRCEPCRQFIVFFNVSDASQYVPSRAEREHSAKNEKRD